ncbi:MAG: CRTAC1 family protein, partial [Gemmatimonadota bacterium]
MLRIPAHAQTGVCAGPCDWWITTGMAAPPQVPACQTDARPPAGPGHRLPPAPLRLRRFALLLLALIAALASRIGAQAFTEIGAAAGVAVIGNAGVSWPDLDGDGLIDLFVLTGSPNPPLLRNNGNGTFTDVSVGAGFSVGGGSLFGVTWGDYDGDGHLDAYLGRNGANRLFRSNGNGTYTNVATATGTDDGNSARGVAWVDYDGDQDLDLYLVNDGAANCLYRNDGGGAFAEVAAAAGVADPQSGRGVAWADFDADGDADAYVAQDDGDANLLYVNQGDGTFTEAGAIAGVNDAGTGEGLAWGDYDNDGQLDLYVTGTGPNLLYHNEGDQTFTEVAGAAGAAGADASRGPAWGDFDNDGFLDLFVSSNASADRLYRNNGNGTFTEVGAAEGVADAGPGAGASWGDFDNDGALDLFVANEGSVSRLYHNAGNGNNWLVLDLQPATGSAAAIGATVTVVAGGLRLSRSVDGGSGYYSQPSLPLEFGLGAAALVDTLIVAWPSGVVQTFAGLTPNHAPAIAEHAVSETTPAAGLAGVTAVAPAGEARLLAVGLTGVGSATLSSLSLTLSDLSAPTGLIAADLAELRLYRSADALLDGGDLLLGTLPQGAITLGAPLTLSPAGPETVPATETFYLVTAAFSAAVTDGHALRVAFGSGGVLTSAGLLGTGFAAADGNRVALDVVASQLLFATQPAGAVSGQPLATQPVVEARDGAGNLDLDFAETVALTTAAPGALSGASAVAVAGVATFTTLTYTATAHNQSVTLIADDDAGVGADLPPAAATPLLASLPAVSETTPAAGLAGVTAVAPAGE